jgi:hypothetical protein
MKLFASLSAVAMMKSQKGIVKWNYQKLAFLGNENPPLNPRVIF